MKKTQRGRRAAARATEPPPVPRPGQLRRRGHDRPVQHRAEHGDVQHARRCGAPDYKGLVCLFLSGGNRFLQHAGPDAARPSTRSTRRARADLALPQGQPAADRAGDAGRPRVRAAPGVRPSCSRCSSRAGWRSSPTWARWSSRHAGSSSRTAAWPSRSGLFSHSDQTMHWQTSIPDQRIPDRLGRTDRRHPAGRATATRTSR